MTATVWALLPPIIAIALALITKEVYSSLLIGILSGALLYTGFSPLGATETMFEIMGGKLGDNIYICIFLVLLGVLVALVTKSGASRAYGEWASKTVRSRRGASFATSFLGCFIFVDDYFNCLTVGTVMRPVTDKYRISRAKLAYIIDATAAPVCIIAPISSWAAAVQSSLPKDSGIDGFALFMQTIPFNLYALLTLAFLVFLIASGRDFGAMARYEQKHRAEYTEQTQDKQVTFGAGRVFDLIIPIAVLILLCIGAMLYTGGITQGAGVAEAFANCDSQVSLVLGSFGALLITFLLYVPRKILSFGQFCESFTEGFRSMVPALLILTLAWTLSGICSADYLNISGFVAGMMNQSQTALMLLPAVFFLVALGLSFSTGTSWGTFGILIPIIIGIFEKQPPVLLVQTVAACLAGSVAGDHVSPISDTTILASAGAQCDHIEHVSTQMPYALLVAAASLGGYIVGGVTGNGYAALGTGAVLLAIICAVLYYKNRKKQA